MLGWEVETEGNRFCIFTIHIFIGLKFNFVVVLLCVFLLASNRNYGNIKKKFNFSRSLCFTAYWVDWKVISKKCLCVCGWSDNMCTLFQNEYTVIRLVWRNHPPPCHLFHFTKSPTSHIFHYLAKILQSESSPSLFFHTSPSIIPLRSPPRILMCYNKILSQYSFYIIQCKA